MKPILATLDRHPDGVLAGLMRTLSIRSQIEIRPIGQDGGTTSYVVIASPDFLLGHGEQRGDPSTAPITVRLRAPELQGPLLARVESTEFGHWIMLWLDT